MNDLPYEKQLEWLNRRLQLNSKKVSIDYYKIEFILKEDLENVCKCYGYGYYETFEDGYRTNKVYKIANFIKKEKINNAED
jgi:hypothetical protein